MPKNRSDFLKQPKETINSIIKPLFGHQVQTNFPDLKVKFLLDWARKALPKCKLAKQNHKLTVITTPPPDFWPKVRPSGLSTSTSMFLAAPAVLAVISRPLLTEAKLLLLSAANTELEKPLLASWRESPWKVVFWGNKQRVTAYTTNPKGFMQMGFRWGGLEFIPGIVKVWVALEVGSKRVWWSGSWWMQQSKKMKFLQPQLMPFWNGHQFWTQGEEEEEGGCVSYWLAVGGFFFVWTGVINQITF